MSLQEAGCKKLFVSGFTSELGLEGRRAFSTCLVGNIDDKPQANVCQSKQVNEVQAKEGEITTVISWELRT